MDVQTLHKLKAACQLHGGQKAVAKVAGVDNSNLGKWFKGHPTLSKNNIAKVLAALDLPDLKPISSRVLVWKSTEITNEILEALSLFFNASLQISERYFSDPGLLCLNTCTDEIELMNTIKNNICLLNDGHVKAVIHLEMSLDILMEISNASFYECISWKSAQPHLEDNRTVLDINKIGGLLSKNPTFEDFNNALSDSANLVTDPNSIEAVWEAIKGEGISYKDAVNRIQKNGSKPPQ